MIKQEYKLLTVKLTKFVIIFLLIDLIIGSAAKHVFFSQKSGKFARVTYALEEATDDMFIFGSSHANAHYIPDIFEKTLKRSCYNVGVRGQRILFHLALQETILERIKPELIILNIDEFWLFESDEAYDRLSDLHPYYWKHRKILKPILSLHSRFTDFKLFFKSYQTNSTILHALKYYFSPQTDYKGYIPFYHQMAPTDKTGENDEIRSQTTEEKLDDNLITAFSKFISNAKDNHIRLICVISPKLHGIDFSDNKSMAKMREIAENENIPVIDFSNDERFNGQYHLFNDISHLNDEGARLFTGLLVEWINDNPN